MEQLVSPDTSPDKLYQIGLDVGSLSFMLREIDHSSAALDKAVDEAVAGLKEDNMESVSNSLLVFVTYTVGSLFLVRKHQF